MFIFSNQQTPRTYCRYCDFSSDRRALKHAKCSPACALTSPCIILAHICTVLLSLCFQGKDFHSGWKYTYINKINANTQFNKRYRWDFIIIQVLEVHTFPPTDSPRTHCTSLCAANVLFMQHGSLSLKEDESQVTQHLYQETSLFERYSLQIEEIMF